MINKRIVPLIFTFGNLVAGTVSLMLTISQHYQLAAIAVFASALCDWVDGRVARFLNVSSPIGKELDSLSDLVSFGVAPALLVWKLSLSALGLAGVIIAVFFPICGAYRLARFNVTQFSGAFEGIPITCAGSLLALFALFMLNFNIAIWLVICIVIILGWMMVSHIRVPKF